MQVHCNHFFCIIYINNHKKWTLVPTTPYPVWSIGLNPFDPLLGHNLYFSYNLHYWGLLLSVCCFKVVFWLKYALVHAFDDLCKPFNLFITRPGLSSFNKCMTKHRRPLSDIKIVIITTTMMKPQRWRWRTKNGMKCRCTISDLMILVQYLKRSGQDLVWQVLQVI